MGYRRLGQNFLVDKNIAKLQVRYAGINSRDRVLEIGPGYGILTKLLAKEAKEVIGIEKDTRLVELLKELRLSNLKIIQGDALKINLERLNFNKIVSNPPYYIASPLTFKLLAKGFQLGVLMYQKEFAERMVAKSGEKNYGRLSVNIYYHAKCELLKRVPKDAFRPKPKVDSIIVKLIPRAKPAVKVNDEDLFFKLVNLIFSQRRKKIKSTLRNNWQKLSENKGKFWEIIEGLPFKEKRPGEISPEEIGNLANILSPNL
jgi:16S rRNA (adenine1518-N6/adenine1519-N6)-dimethyltransferase